MELDPIQLLIVGAVAVMIFGGNLPEVAKKFGRTLADFKGWWESVRNEFTSALDVPGAQSTATTSARRHRPDDLDDALEATAPKFEPPPRPNRATPP